MIRSMCYSWKQPIGFCITSGIMSAVKIINSKKSIDLLNEINLTPKLVICEQSKMH